MIEAGGIAVDIGAGHGAEQQGAIGGTARAMPVTSLVLSTCTLGAFISLKDPLRVFTGVAMATAAIGTWLLAPQFVAH